MADLTDRDLVRLYWPAELRGAFDALFDIDDAMAEVVARATEPTLAAIKLAWWREALARLDTALPPAEPRLQSAASELIPRGISGAELSSLEEGRLVWLRTDECGDDEIEEFRLHGRLMFGLAARLLGQDDQYLSTAGEAWVLANQARRMHDVVSRVHLLLHSQFLGEEIVSYVFPKSLRPLTMLTTLGHRDALVEQILEPEATPGRAFALLRHRLTGRIS